jgi:competence/damage-inducible protein cinA C-terminal domain
LGYNNVGDIMKIKDLVLKLIDKEKTISSMESCTGGGFANEITNIEGASDILKFSAVTYSNEYKIKMGVSKELIDKYSVYSFEVSDSMALNISEFTNSDFGVGITGKLNRVDKNNPYGEDNVVFVSVFDRENKKYYHRLVEAVRDSRCNNKELVIENVCDIFEELLK